MFATGERNCRTLQQSAATLFPTAPSAKRLVPWAEVPQPFIEALSIYWKGS